LAERSAPMPGSTDRKLHYSLPDQVLEFAIGEDAQLFGQETGDGSLWEETIDRANLTRYLEWLARHRALSFANYQELWRWSVTDLDAFWSSIWQYFGIRASRPYCSAGIEICGIALAGSVARLPPIT